MDDFEGDKKRRCRNRRKTTSKATKEMTKNDDVRSDAKTTTSKATKETTMSKSKATKKTETKPYLTYLMVIGILRRTTWSVGPALIELIALIETSTIFVWCIIPDMCPVGVQVHLEGGQRGRANHFCRECVPTIHGTHRKCRSPHPTTSKATKKTT